MLRNLLFGSKPSAGDIPVPPEVCATRKQLSAGVDALGALINKQGWGPLGLAEILESAGFAIATDAERLAHIRGMIESGAVDAYRHLDRGVVFAAVDACDKESVARARDLGDELRDRLTRATLGRRLNQQPEENPPVLWHHPSGIFVFHCGERFPGGASAGAYADEDIWLVALPEDEDSGLYDDVQELLSQNKITTKFQPRAKFTHNTTTRLSAVTRGIRGRHIRTGSYSFSSRDQYNTEFVAGIYLADYRRDEAGKNATRSVPYLYADVKRANLCL
ncbi:hypothetical protein [Celeribacter arenosi]|uniref:Nucleotidyltransferase n=1 Tax=Celeribacter arenosi TaxID=792649 RepID=A0ABP7K285_9RHOB